MRVHMYPGANRKMTIDVNAINMELMCTDQRICFAHIIEHRFLLLPAHTISLEDLHHLSLLKEGKVFTLTDVPILAVECRLGESDFFIFELNVNDGSDRGISLQVDQLQPQSPYASFSGDLVPFPLERGYSGRVAMLSDVMYMFLGGNDERNDFTFSTGEFVSVHHIALVCFPILTAVNGLHNERRFCVLRGQDPPGHAYAEQTLRDACATAATFVCPPPKYTPCAARPVDLFSLQQNKQAETYLMRTHGQSIGAVVSMPKYRPLTQDERAQLRDAICNRTHLREPILTVDVRDEDEFVEVANALMSDDMLLPLQPVGWRVAFEVCNPLGGGAAHMQVGLVPVKYSPSPQHQAMVGRLLTTATTWCDKNCAELAALSDASQQMPGAQNTNAPDVVVKPKVGTSASRYPRFIIEVEWAHDGIRELRTKAQRYFAGYPADLRAVLGIHIKHGSFRAGAGLWRRTASGEVQAWESWDFGPVALHHTQTTEWSANTTDAAPPFANMRRYDPRNLNWPHTGHAPNWSNEERPLCTVDPDVLVVNMTNTPGLSEMESLVFDFAKMLEDCARV